MAQNQISSNLPYQCITPGSYYVPLSNNTCTTPVFLAIVPVFVVAGILTNLGLTKGKAKFLAQVAMTIGSFSIFVHGKASLTDGMAGKELGEILGISFVQGDDNIPLVDAFDGVVDMLGIILRVMASGRFPALRCSLSP